MGPTRPADTRLLPTTFPTRRWKVHRLYAAYPSLGSLPRLRPLMAYSPPAVRPGGRPDTLGSPEATAPRLDSPVASLGTPPPTATGRSIRPTPSERSESVWGSYPFRDSPVSPLGDAHSPRDGRESALPSLRMVERFPHTDGPQGETPSGPADLRVWRSLAPRSPAPWSRPFHRLPPGTTSSPSFLPTPIAPRGIHPSWGAVRRPAPSSPVGRRHIKNANAFFDMSIFLWGWGVSTPPREIPRNPFRRHSIKPATSSINVQSKPPTPSPSWTIPFPLC